MLRQVADEINMTFNSRFSQFITVIKYPQLLSRIGESDFQRQLLNNNNTVSMLQYMKDMATPTIGMY